MDPVCHTLMGGALAQAGLKRRTTLATATLLIGANLPDIDVLAYAWGPLAALDFRRGWTHGIMALALLPLVLTGGILLWDRWRSSRQPGRTAAIPGQVLLLASIAILTHPILDTLNTYGVRWLMPFSEQWFYGDTLFIVDPWAWLFLGAGIWLSRRRERKGGWEPWSPARRGLALFAVYVAVMIAGSVTAHGLVEGAYRRLAGRSPVRLMAAPVAITPFRRPLVIEEPDAYRVGTFYWLPYPHVEGGRDFSVPSDDLLEEPFMSAAATPEGAAFLRWARFPTLVVTGPETDRSVYIIDLRYATEPGASFGTIRIPAPRDRDILVQRPRESGRAHAAPLKEQK